MSTIIAESYLGGIAQKVHCRKAACEECAPILRSQLVARGCQGQPNKSLTWTSRVRADQTPEEACVELKLAVMRCILHARRQLKVKPELRWKIPNGYKDLRRELQVSRYAKEDDAAGRTEIAYLWTTEAHKSGWPHLHMVARTPHIPQEWLSWQMGKLLDSPVVGVTAIRDVQRQVGYIVGYIAKEEHRFGNSRRYSFSQNYKLPGEIPYSPFADPSFRRLVVNKPVQQVEHAWRSNGRETRQEHRGRVAWGDLPGEVIPDCIPPPAIWVVEHTREQRS